MGKCFERVLKPFCVMRVSENACKRQKKSSVKLESVNLLHILFSWQNTLSLYYKLNSDPGSLYTFQKCELFR